MAVKVMLRGLNTILSVCWLPHQLSHAWDDVSTVVFDTALVIVNLFHILESVNFQLAKCHIIRSASQELPDANCLFDAWETQSGVIFISHMIVVRLHAVRDHPMLHILVLFTRLKQEVCFMLKVCLEDTLCVQVMWLSEVIAQWSTRRGFCFHPRLWRRLCLRLPVCYVLKGFEVGIRLKGFNGIIPGVQFITLILFNKSWHAGNTQIPSAHNFKVFRLV
jgi:hypothetical protein